LLNKNMDDPTSPTRPIPPLTPVTGDVEALPAGSRLEQFEVLRVLGSGGFGIVYLALDHSLQRHVAIKEYLPAVFAGRAADGGLAVRSPKFAATFNAGLHSFVNEARLLARFDHPALVKVHHFWEANSTAYMVMPYYQGATLRQVRQSMSLMPDEAWLRRILDALLGALDVVHGASVYHRDVAPDNVLLLPDGKPVLLDFGSARHVLGDQTQTITAVVKPAYAPIEQYAAASEFRHGPWTDIYATAATLHYCLLGIAPPTAAARSVQDTYRPLAERPELRNPVAGMPYNARWLAALDWALAVKPQERPQSIAEWREALSGKVAVPVTARATLPTLPESAAVTAAVPLVVDDEPFPMTEVLPTGPEASFPASARPATRRRGRAPVAAAAHTPARRTAWVGGTVLASVLTLAVALPFVAQRGGFNAATPVVQSSAAPPISAVALAPPVAAIEPAPPVADVEAASPVTAVAATPPVTASAAPHATVVAAAAPVNSRSAAPQLHVELVEPAQTSPASKHQAPSLHAAPDSELPAVARNQDGYEALVSSLALAEEEDDAAAPPPRTRPRMRQTSATSRIPSSLPANGFMDPPSASERGDRETAQGTHRAPVVTVRPLLVSAMPPAPIGPREVCSKQGWWGASACMSETCAQRRWAQHAQCTNWRQLDRRTLTQAH
jgi:serine/threonine protein kinase